MRSRQLPHSWTARSRPQTTERAVPWLYPSAPSTMRASRCGHSGSSQTSDSILVETGDNALNPPGDFEPALPGVDESASGGVECALSGCTTCVGSKLNGYCFDDADCPVDHRCLTPDREQHMPPLGTPLCVLRPVLEDGRLKGAAKQADDVAERDLQFSLLGEMTQPVRSFRQPLLSALGNLSLPRRSFGTAAGVVDTIELVYFDFLGHITSAHVEWRPDPRSEDRTLFPGSGELVLSLELDGRFKARGHFRRFARDSDFKTSLNIRTVELPMRPVVEHRAGRSRIHLRALSARLLNPHGGTTIDVNIEALGPFDVVDRMAERKAVIEGQAGDLTDSLGGMTNLAESLLRQVVEEALVGGALFGVEHSDGGFVGTRPSGQLESMLGMQGALDLRYRGDRALFGRGFDGTLLRTPSRTFCCNLAPALTPLSAEPEPEPSCLEEENCDSVDCRDECLESPPTRVLECAGP